MKRRILIGTGGLIVVAVIGGALLSRDAVQTVLPASSSAGRASIAAAQAGVPLPGVPAERARSGASPSFDVVRVGPRGEAVMAGRAAPHAEIAVVDGGDAIGRTTANARGEWVVIPDKTLSPGNHSLSVRAGDSGRSSDALALVLAPPSRDAAMSASTSPSQGEAPAIIVVRSGNSLWRIARQSYGNGGRYAVIYGANRDRIGDPNLIYPGQVFTLPATN